MKNLIKIGIVLCLMLTAYGVCVCQVLNIYVSGINVSGGDYENEISIGSLSGAHLGIDTLLESNIDPDSTLMNLYAIQRNDSLFECLYSINDEKILFNDNISLRNDFRDLSNAGVNRYFQIKIASPEVHKIVVFQPQFLNIKDFVESYSVIFNCGDTLNFFQSKIETDNLGFEFNSFEVENSEPFSSLIIKYWDINLKDKFLNGKNQQLVINPNPCYNGFSINELSIGVRNLTLFDVNGDKVKEFKNVEGSNYFDITDLSPGLYFFKAFMPNSDWYAGKIIKI